MIVTEEQARQKWCPMAQRPVGDYGTYHALPRDHTQDAAFCIASRCMMWCTVSDSVTGAGEIGYCGLAGQQM